MSEKKRISLALAAVALALGAFLAWSLNRPDAPAANPRANASTTSRLDQRIPYDPQLTSKDIAFWAGRVRDDPQAVMSMAQLGSLYLRHYRETGDSANAVKAEQTARRSLRVRKSPGAYELLSRALLTQHRFHEALAAADQVTTFTPDGNRARTDILLDLGENAAAARALTLVPQTANDPNRITLRGRLWEAQGRNEEALKLYQESARLLDGNIETSPEAIAGAHRQVALVLYNLGRVDEAEREYKQAIKFFPPDYQSLYGLARLSAGRGDWKNAIEWGEKAAAIVPVPEVIALLGDAKAALGDNAAAEKQYQLVEDIGALGKAQGITYDRQRALFYADHDRNLKEALQLARNEMKMRHDAYTYDTLAWVSYQNGLLKEAKTAMKNALAGGRRDALLEYHAGVIAHGSGDDAAAKTHLAKALEINPYFYPPSPKHARELLAKLNAP